MTDQSLLPGVVLGWWLTFAVHSVSLLLVTAIVQWAVRGIRPLLRDAIWKVAFVIPLLSATWFVAGGVHPVWQWRSTLTLPSQAAREEAQPHDQSSSAVTDLRMTLSGTDGRIVTEDPEPAAAIAASSNVSQQADRVVTRVLLPLVLSDPDYNPDQQPPTASDMTASFRSVVSDKSPIVTSPLPAAAAPVPGDLRRDLHDNPAAVLAGRVPTRQQFAIWGLLVCWTWSLARCGVAQLRLGRLIRTASPDRDVNQVLTDVRRRLGYRGRVRLLVSERVGEPMACGVFRPAVLLPTSLLLQLDRGQLEEVLAHELSHLSRRDLMWLGLFRLVIQLVPGHWLAGWAVRRWRENAELLCDDWMLHRGFSRTVLAAALVAVSEWKLNRATHTPAGCVTFASRSSAVSRRVVRLLEGGRTGPAQWTRRQQICWLVVVVAGPLIVCRCLPAASFRHPERVQLERIEAERAGLRTVATGIQVEQESDQNVGRDTDAKSLADVEQELRELQNELEVVESLLRQLDDPGVLQLAGNLQDRAKRVRERLEQLKSSGQPGRSHGDDLVHVGEDSRGDE